ncbi:MAG: TonB-dependent receptor [Vicinamibacterales bacterium]
MFTCLFTRRMAVTALFGLFIAVQAPAATISGSAADPSGEALDTAQITLQNLATGAELVVTSDGQGRFRFDDLTVGIYRVSIGRSGFSADSRTLSIADPADRLDVAFVLRPGGLTATVTVTATRSERDALEVPLSTANISRDELLRSAPLSTGDAMASVPSVTLVGSGPYVTRPRLRGLDSTRVLVLVDGERLNNARTATDRAGTEVGLVGLSSVENIEVVNGAGSVLYGTDALAGTINLLTNQPTFSDSLRFNYGFDGLYSTNEHGRRGAVTLGASNRKFAAQIIAGLEAFGNYHAGGKGTEDTRSFFSDGRLRRADTIDDNFGFTFKAFPDPFNAPFTRNETEIPSSQAEGRSVNASALFALTNLQTLNVKYIHRRMEDIGFADFAQPYFFQRVTLPYSTLDRISARYEARALTPWFTNLKVSGYFQDQKRLLRNELPVQFPAPSAAFFPISVFRLNIVSNTEQHVKTPGFDLQATFLPSPAHVVTAGTTVYTDISRDDRTSTTQTTLIGDVSLGARGPQATVYPSPIVLGVPTTTRPVRVPDAHFRDIGVFVQDEWALGANLKLVLGARFDNYRVATDPTTGYDVASLVAGAVPAIDPSTLPDVGGDRISRNAVTGDAGLVYRVNDQVSVSTHYGRSYRHANLEELLFAGPATIGAIVPNVKVKPETGHNVDVGVKMRSSRYAAALSYFNNTYDGFISTEIVAETPSDALSQAINFADVRIQGIEGEAQVPVELKSVVLTLFGNFAYTHGEILEGTNLFTGTTLDHTPQDNISPFKAVTGIRVASKGDRLWAEYGNRHQAEVDRVAVSLIESPYLIAQDLLSLRGFTLHRLAWGASLTPSTGRLGVTFAIENLTNEFYREQFQFAPARGRTFTMGVTIQGR